MYSEQKSGLDIGAKQSSEFDKIDVQISERDLMYNSLIPSTR